MNRWRELGIFLLCSILICLAVFRGAFWGSRILAPLDIAPTMFSKYRYVDPAVGNVPANHYIIDGLTFDLPLQYTIYNAYRHGEIPWWDPYTYAGHPLLADAHVNGTDPIRILCYLTLPFVPAYNWNLILKSILTGVGVFILLRHLRFSSVISTSLALTYQFAGCFALFFCHPWIEASFAYYPLLWTVWSLGSEKPSLRLDAAGAALCALIFYSGNLQSHAYLLLFSLAALLGYGFVNRNIRWRVPGSILFSGLLGAALASPVIWPQIEYYLNSLRVASFTSPSHWTFLAGLLSFSSVFPWALGTFRTLDLGKIIEVNAAGFAIFIGSAAFCLAAIGCWKHSAVEQKPAQRMAIALAVIYFVVCSTPLLNLLYTRMAPLAVVGLTVLAACGLRAVSEGQQPLKKLSWTIAGLATAIMLALNLTAFVVYPRYISRVHELVADHDKTNPGLDTTPALRSFQVDNLPHEISVQNPEAVLAFVSLIALAIYLRRPKRTPSAQAALLILNFLPLIFFFSRYVPNQPIAYWERLLNGGPEQRRVAQTLNPKYLRLLEESPGLNDMLFPNNMGHLQRVHTVHGYSALHPPSLGHWPSNQPPPAPKLVADFIYRSDTRGQEAGQLVTAAGNERSRLQCDKREISIIEETLDTLTATVAPGPASKLFRTDTFYPGWCAELNREPVPLRRQDATPFSTLDLPANDAVSTVTYTYQPSHFVLTFSLSIAAGIAVIGLGALSRRT